MLLLQSAARLARSRWTTFLAWSRWPNDAIENLVAADHCNGAKSDHLADGTHLDHWFEHVDHHGDDLVELATSVRWISDAARSMGLVRSTYSHIVRGTPLWVAGRDVHRIRWSATHA